MSKLDAVGRSIRAMVVAGTTEMGNPFMVRQSYLPHEIHWGHTFQSIIGVPPQGQTRYTVDMTRCQS